MAGLAAAAEPPRGAVRYIHAVGRQFEGTFLRAFREAEPVVYAFAIPGDGGLGDEDEVLVDGLIIGSDPVRVIGITDHAATAGRPAPGVASNRLAAGQVDALRGLDLADLEPPLLVIPGGPLLPALLDAQLVQSQLRLGPVFLCLLSRGRK